MTIMLTHMDVSVTTLNTGQLPQHVCMCVCDCAFRYITDNSRSNAVWCISFLGIQPTLTHVPPRPSFTDRQTCTHSVIHIITINIKQSSASATKNRTCYANKPLWHYIHCRQFTTAIHNTAVPDSGPVDELHKCTAAHKVRKLPVILPMLR